MKTSLRFCLPLLAIAPLVALAQPKKPAAPPKAAAPTDSDGQIDITNAPDGTAIYDDGQGMARITKNVVITQRGENLIVYAQEAVYSRPRNQATATGQLRVITRDSTIRGTSLRADFNDRQFTITGNVTITSHGKNDGAMAGLRAEAQKKPVRVLCNQVVWDYDLKQATATGNIRIFQGDNTGTCNKIIYDEGQNIVKLLGRVRFGDNQDRNFVAEEVDVYIDSDVVTTPHVRLLFPERAGMNGQNPSTKTPRAPKTGTSFKPRPTLPPDLLQTFNITPTPEPTLAPEPTEQPAPTPAPDEPAEDEPKN